MLLHGGGDGIPRGGRRARSGWRRQGGLYRVPRQLYEGLSALEFPVLAGHRFGLKSQRIARRVRETAADLRAKRAAEISAEGRPGQRKCFLGGALQQARQLPDRPAI